MFEEESNCSNSTLNTSNISNQNQNLIQFSLRPISLMKPFDLNPLKILNFMRNEIFSPKNVILSNLEEIKRKNLILNMKKFLIKYNFEYKILFIAVYFMDNILFKLNFHSKDLDSIAIGCLILAVKFYDKNGKIPNLNFFQEILPNYSNFTLNEIKKIEILCLKYLNYNLNFPQPLNFIEILLLNGIVFTNDLIYLNVNSKIYNLPFKIYEKIILANADYLKFNPFYLAFAFVAVSRKLFSLEKWNTFFNSIFNVSFEEIEYIYNEIPNLIIKHEQFNNNNSNILIYEKKINKNNIYNKMKNNNILNQAFCKTLNSNKNKNNNNNDNNKSNIIYKANKNISFTKNNNNINNNINNNNFSYNKNNNKITSYTYSKSNYNNINNEKSIMKKINIFKNKIFKNTKIDENLNKSTKDLTCSDSKINLQSNFTNYRKIIDFRNNLFINSFDNNNNSLIISTNHNSNENDNSILNKNKTCTLFKNKYLLNNNNNNNNNINNNNIIINESFEIKNFHSNRENLEEKKIKKNNDLLNNNSFLKNFKNYQIKGIPYYTKKINAAINLKKHILSINYRNNNIDNEKIFSSINL